MTTTRSDGAAYRLSTLTSPAEWDEPRLRERWDRITEASDNPNALYGSRAWFDLLRAKHRPDDLALLAAYGQDGEAVGVVPVLFERHPFQYYVSSYPVLTLQLRAAHVLGSVPSLPPDAALHGRLLKSLLAGGADCVYMDSVPVESPCRELLKEAGKGYLTYAPGGPRPWHLLRLPAGSAAYLSQMSSKTRQTLKRKAKKLAEAGGGELEFVRVDSAGQVADFLADAVRVSRNSWQQSILGTRIDDTEEERAWSERAAEAGLLRNYLLKSGGRPCAFVVGYQFNGVFQYVELGYDRDFAEHSPGTVLLHMLIQDLCDHRPASLLNFGLGDADYKQRFGNVQREDMSVIIFRKNLFSYSAVGSHSLFRALVRAARTVVRRVRK